jgi:Berberine and berberine like
VTNRLETPTAINILTGSAVATTARTGEPYAKPVAVKKRYDPANVFRLNQGVPPMSDDQQGALDVSTQMTSGLSLKLLDGWLS